MSLTRLAWQLYKKCMPGGMEFHDALETQYEGDAKRLRDLDVQLSELRPAFVRYKDLSVERAKIEERLRVLISMIGYLFPKEKLRELHDFPGITIKSPEDEREHTSLWKVLREFARQVNEIRIVELEAVLAQYGYKISRQAIESAIETHEKTFRSEKRGRERFVSLK